jgi:hypothetical protein
MSQWENERIGMGEGESEWIWKFDDLKIELLQKVKLSIYCHADPDYSGEASNKQWNRDSSLHSEWQNSTFWSGLKIWRFENEKMRDWGNEVMRQWGNETMRELGWKIGRMKELKDGSNEIIWRFENVVIWSWNDGAIREREDGRLGKFENLVI